MGSGGSSVVAWRKKGDGEDADEEEEVVAVTVAVTVSIRLAGGDRAEPALGLLLVLMVLMFLRRACEVVLRARVCSSLRRALGDPLMVALGDSLMLAFRILEGA